MCGRRYNGPLPEDMLPIGTPVSMVVYAPGRETFEEYTVFEGKINGHTANNVAWNYNLDVSMFVPSKNGRGGAGLGTHEHRNSGSQWDSDFPFPRLMKKYINLAGKDVYSMYITDRGIDRGGLDCIEMLTTLKPKEGIKLLKEIVKGFNADRYAEAMAKIECYK